MWRILNLDWWIHPFSSDTEDHEHVYTVYECKYHLNSSGTMPIGTTCPCRHGYHKGYPQERYSRFFPGLGQGWSRFDCDNPPETSHSRGFWFDTERHRTNIGQGQQAQDPDSWTPQHLLQLKMEYEVLINKYGWKVQDMYTVQDHPAPPSEFLLLPPLDSLYKVYVWNQELPQPGDSRLVSPPSWHTLSQ
jgi:hypothetical protein